MVVWLRVTILIWELRIKSKWLCSVSTEDKWELLYWRSQDVILPSESMTCRIKKTIIRDTDHMQRSWMEGVHQIFSLYLLEQAWFLITTGNSENTKQRLKTQEISFSGLLLDSYMCHNNFRGTIPPWDQNVHLVKLFLNVLEQDFRSNSANLRWFFQFTDS